MNEQKKFVPALGFDFLTAWYDATIRLTMPEGKFRGLLMDELDPQAGEKILEFGFGTAQNLLLAKSECLGAELRGLDIDPKIKALAAHKLAKNGFDIPLDLYDGGRFPYPEAQFDKVYSCLSFPSIGFGNETGLPAGNTPRVETTRKIGHRRLGQSRRAADAACLWAGSVARRFQNDERQRARANARFHPRGGFSKRIGRTFHQHRNRYVFLFFI